MAGLRPSKAHSHWTKPDPERSGEKYLQREARCLFIPGCSQIKRGPLPIGAAKHGSFHMWMEMGRSGNLMSEPNISMLAGCPQGRISTTRRKRLGIGWKGGLWKIATFDAHQVRRSCRDEFTREGLRIVHDIEINQLLQLDIVSPREYSCDGSHSFVSFRGLSVVSKSARGQRLQSQCAQQATATACFCLQFFTKQGGSSLAQRLWLASSHPHPPNRFCPHSQILEHPRLPSAQQLRAPLNAVHHICEKSRHILANRHVGNDLAEARL